MRGGGVESQGLRENLLGAASGRLSEGLKVLAADVEDHVEQASRNISSGDLLRAASSRKEAQRIVGELKLQAKKASRQEQAAFEETIKSLERRLESLERDLRAAETLALTGASAGQDERARRKAAASALKLAAEVQEDSQTCIDRSLNIVAQAQNTGTDTAVLLRSQTEQMKSIYADVAEMDDNLTGARKILGQMARRAVTDRITLCLLILVVLASAGAVIVKIMFPKASPSPWFPPSPSPSPPSPLPPETTPMP